MRGVNFENDKFQIVKETKKLANVFYFDCSEFMDLELFMPKLFVLEFGYKYIILVRVIYKDKSGDNSEWKTLGEQIVIKDLNSNSFKIIVGNIHRTILSRLESSMDKYGYNAMSVVGFQMIIYKTGTDIVTKKHKINNSSFGESKDLVNMSDLTESVNKIYPITNVRYDFGILLEKEVNKDIVEYITLLDGSKIDFQSCVNLYSKKYIFNSNMNFYQRKLDNSNHIFVVENTDCSTQSINVFDISGMWIQHIMDKDIDSNSFSRQIGNVCFHINRNGIYKKDIYIKFPHIYPNNVSGWLNRLTQPNHKIGTLDIETYNIEKVAYAYAIGFYVQGDLQCFYIDKNLNSDNLIIRCLDGMLVEKYNGYTFYVHNLHKFDIYFIIHALIKVDSVYPNKYQFKDNIVYRDGDIISIKISTKINGKTYSVKLVDSLLLLQSSLDKLCKTFNTNVKKTSFPYTFVNKHNLWYIGNKPDIKYYKDVISKSIEEDNENMDESKKMCIITDIYDKIPKENWSLKDETLSYLGNDLISLHNVMEKFITSIFINYHIHATKSLTISSLSMDIFLKRFYDNNIPLIKQKSIYNNIKQSYYGGITEVYKPYGKNLLYYDVNSLYPYAALNNMPGLNCVYTDNINSNIGDILDNIFGFYYCKIKTNDGYLGLLPHRTNNGLIQPLGEFEGWYFSEELKFAYEHGYNIHVVSGYNFDKSKNVFDKYFTELYKIKSNSTDKVDRAIAKSMLNNLIGKLGLDINKYTTKIMPEKEFVSILKTRKYRGVQYLDGTTVLASYDTEVSKSICETNDLNYKDILLDILKSKNSNGKITYKEEKYNSVSIALASAITAYSRIYMNKIKLHILNKGGKLYYTDTDSIVTDIKLDSSMVGIEMGKFKLEHEVAEGYFISNKTYAITTTSGKVVIRTKGIYKKSLAYSDFEKLYLNKDVEAIRYETKRDYYLGSASLFNPLPIKISPNSYVKRTKIFNSKNAWIDTKPIYLYKKEYPTLNYKKYIFKTIFNYIKNIVNYTSNIFVDMLLGLILGLLLLIIKDLANNLDLINKINDSETLVYDSKNWVDLYINDDLFFIYEYEDLSFIHDNEYLYDNDIIENSVEYCNTTLSNKSTFNQQFRKFVCLFNKDISYKVHTKKFNLNDAYLNKVSGSVENYELVESNTKLDRFKVLNTLKDSKVESLYVNYIQELNCKIYLLELELNRSKHTLNDIEEIIDFYITDYNKYRGVEFNHKYKDSVIEF